MKDAKAFAILAVLKVTQAQPLVRRSPLATVVNQLLMVFGVVFLLLTFVIALDPAKFAQLGYPGVFVFNLFGPGTFLVPLVAQEFNLVLLAFVSALGMSANDSVLYLLGRSGQLLVEPGKKSAWAKNLVTRYGRKGLFAVSIIPFPLDFVGGTVGYLGFPYHYYLLPTILGKFLRFFILGLVIKTLF